MSESQSVARVLAAAGIEFIGATRASVRGRDVALGATGESVAANEDRRPVSRAPYLSGRGEAEWFSRPDKDSIDLDIPLTVSTLPS
jgi:hypothetical protein